MRFILTFLVAAFAHAENPWSLEHLRQPPKADWGAKDGLTQEVWYEGEPFAGKATRIFAYVGRPEGAGPHPAVVLVHGGGGEAFRDWAVHWAKRGYVSIAMDTAGKGPKKSVNPDAGPDQEDRTKFRTDLPARDMWTYHAVAAAIRGHSLLLSLPEVDKAKTALTGISWGGYLTCIIAGVDERFKAAVPVYGCGFLHENSAWKAQWLDKMAPEARAEWVAKWDPSSHLANVRCPILFFNGTNDFAYPLDSYRECYNLVRPELRHISVIIELPHGHMWRFPEPDAFIDSVLLGKDPLPRLGDIEVKDGIARARLTSSKPPVGAELCYTLDSGPWQKRKWKSSAAEIKDGIVTAKIPDGRGVTFFLSVTDKNGAKATTAHTERD
jgi:dienelactone hydrolase